VGGQTVVGPVWWTQERLAVRVARELGADINADYAGDQPLMVAVLRRNVFPERPVPGRSR